MLKIHKPTPKRSGKMVEDPNMKALFNKLTETEARPNIITLDVFKEFEPLFKKNNGLSEPIINDLTKRYVKLIDFYKETQIIESSHNPKVVLTLPSIFTPIRSLEHTEKNEALVATNAAMSHSNVPKYSEDAFANMFIALKEEQGKNQSVIQTYKLSYIKRIREFFEKYPKKTTVTQITDQEESYSIGSETSWDVD